MVSPYFGVTGFMSADQVRQALGYMPMYSSRRLMVGVLASSKTIQGMSNNHSHKYPTVDRLGSIFINDGGCLNLIHYSTDDKETLFDQLETADSLAGIFCDGFQLNIPWPNVNQLERFYSTRPREVIILQLGSRALAEVDHDPNELVNRLRGYKDVAQGVLLNTSGGTGKPFQPKMMLQYLEAIQDSGLGFGLGVAGGLSANTASSLLKPLSRIRNLSVDAEGRLMKSDGGLDMDKVKLYLRQVNYTLP